MANSINTNTAASYAVYNMGLSTAKQQESQKRLSSGTRLNNTSDDSGASSVSLRSGATLLRLDAVESNLVNALSFLQCQAGGLQEISSMLERMSELTTLMLDPTKTAGDLDNYMAEFNGVREQMGSILEQKYNGVDLFKFQGATTALTVYLDDAGTQTLSMSQSDFTLNNGWTTLVGLAKPYSGIAGATDTVANLVSENTWGSSSFQLLIADLASLSATNASEQSRLTYALDSVRASKVNISQANSRVSDTDMAAEATSLSRSTVLLQSSANVLTKANESDQVLLKILGA